MKKKIVIFGLLIVCMLSACGMYEDKNLGKETVQQTEIVAETIEQESKEIQETDMVSNVLDVSGLTGVWAHKETPICIIFDAQSPVEGITGKIEMYNVDVYTLDHTPESVFQSNYIFEMTEDKMILSVSVPEGWWTYELEYDTELDEIILRNEDGKILILFRQ